MLITEKRLRRLIRRTLLEDNNNGPPLAEVKAVLESLIPDAKERFKSDNRRFIRSLARGLSPLNIFKRRAVIKALRNFDVVINVVDRVDHRDKNVLGFYTLSRDQQFYDNLKRTAEEFEENAGESREEIEREIQELERFLDENEPSSPYGTVTLSAESIGNYYSRLWDEDDPSQAEFKDAVLSNILYEEISHFLDFFATTVINDVLGSKPFSIEGDEGEWIIKLDEERVGSVSSTSITIDSLRGADILESDFKPGGDNTELILRKIPTSQSQAEVVDREAIPYVTDPTELAVALSELKSEFGDNLNSFFDNDPLLSGIDERTKLMTLYIILDPSKRDNLRKYLRKFIEIRGPS